ncbi:hypothetical protein BDZ89DRAFT_483110 [Hymenopellis radicata]|nr:hypothetical protein BDZ89DRAFT_483110 [Hymenopellis radicata]
MSSDSSSTIHVSSISSFIIRRLMVRALSLATGTRPDVLQVSPNALPTVPAALEHLLSSNDPPSDAEIPVLHELHALFSTHITRLDDEVDSLLSSPYSEKTSALEQLEDDRAVCQRFVGSFLNTRYPPRVLSH